MKKYGKGGAGQLGPATRVSNREGAPDDEEARPRCLALQECFRIVGAIGDGAHWECMKFLRPGVTENQVTAHLMQYLYNIPGMEDVEDVIVSSGPNSRR
jgi:hypothetical protein